MNRPWFKFYPEGVPHQVELPSLSVYQLLEQTERDYPQQIAAIDRENKLTYAQLKQAVDRFSASLHRLGFQKGDRVAVMFPNSLEYIISYYGILRLGGIVVQVNPMYQQTELEYILHDSGVKWFVGHHTQKLKLKQIGLDKELHLILAGAEPGNGEKDLYQLVSQSEGGLPDLEVMPTEDVAVLQYTGGTTGRSKGVMLTHYNLVSNVVQSFTFSGGAMIRGKERMLSISPFFHVYGMTSAMNIAVYSAATIICQTRFEVNQTLELIKKHKPTFFPGVPAMYISLLHHPLSGFSGLDSIKVCNSGSAPMPVEVMHEFEKKTGSRIMEGYGLSETSPVTHRNPIRGLRKAGSIGLPIPNTDCKVVDIETGERELPPGEPGELIIKGPQVMKGYWNKPEETALNLRNGWLYTGDIATMDEDGFFYIVGRKKEMIIASGFNIYPIEIEDILYQHPAIEEVCIYGVPDPYRGETVKAAIVCRKGAKASEDEIISWCNEKMARYKVPRLIEFRDSLPKTTVGKILRRKLVEEELKKMNK